eukprot:jgi/Picre1/35270/NNA_002732.t1
MDTNEGAACLFSERILGSIECKFRGTFRFLRERCARCLGRLGRIVSLEVGVLWLQDKFFSDHLGRKIIVMGPNRQAAADSIKAFLEDLTGVEPTDVSLWRYVDPKKKIHGPYGHAKMLAWYHKGYFESKMAMLYENPVIRVWVPVWILEYVEHSDSTGVPGQKGVDGMEWEATVQDVAELRTSYVEVVQKHDDGSVGGTEAVRGGFGGGVAPMDYDAVEVAWDDGM